MTATEITIITLGVATIAWVNWHFFVAGRAAPVVAATPATGPTSGATPEITITVDGGYAPNAVRVAAGTAVRLIFDRRDTSSCSEEVVFPDFGIRRFLPTGEKTVIEITPPAPGQYDFMCGMSMLRGKLIAS